MRIKTRSRNKKARKTRKRKTFRGGISIPFSGVGSLLSDFSNSISSMMGTFNVIPSGYNPPDTPNLSKQFLNPTNPSINPIYKAF